MHIVVAPNAFKNSLSAEKVAFAIRDGLLRCRLNCTVACFPIGDGGDGTDDLLIGNLDGSLVNVTVADPLGRRINTVFGLVDKGKTAVIGMAKASGISLLQPAELDPLLTSSYGTGEQVRAALDQGVSKIIIGMGGSATVDGGAGILKALGISFLNREGKPLEGLPGKLVELDSIDTKGLDPRILQTELVVLCDVENQLLGSEGAAAVFGPQKGATAEGVDALENSLRQFAEVTLRQTGQDIATVKHGGTAGGAAAGLYAFLGARLVNGIDYFLELTRFEDTLQNADLLITGEGSIDEQTLQGKGPFGVARKARVKGIPVVGLAGKVPLHQRETLQAYFDVLLPIGNQPGDLTAAMGSTAENLARTAGELGNLLALFT